MSGCNPTVLLQLVRVGLLCASAAGCHRQVVASASPAALRREFAISSEQGTFVVRGNLNGSIRVTGDELTVVVRRGAVFSGERLLDLRYAAIIVGPTAAAWDIVVRTPIRSLGGIGEGERRSLTDSTVFVAQLPQGLNLATHWLGFEFYVNGGRPGEADGTTYACERVALSGVWLPRTC